MAKLISGKTILIIGGAGFIGWSLARTLSDNEVVILDDLSNPCVLFDPEKFEFHKSSVTYISDVLGRRNFDYIFHFGEYSRVEQSLNEFQYVFDQNTRQLPSLLEYCKMVGAKLVYSGSSSIFSDMRYPERLSPYTLFKKLNCDILKSYAYWYGLDYAICYFSNVYGIGECNSEGYQTVVEKFISMVLAGEKHLPVTGDGLQVRQFTSVQDTIDGIIRVAKLGSGDNFCITAGKEYSILDLVKLVGGIPKFNPDKITNRRSTTISASKLHALGWRPQESLEEYVQSRLIK